ncbi:unnamed protein product [Withania somnifera]
MEQILHNVVLLLLIFSSKPHGRELRPSEHGLTHQHSSKSNDPQLHSFFTGAGEKTPPSLPEARNLTWSDNGVSRDSNRKDHVRQVLLLFSLVCGAAGVVLLAVSAAIFFVRLRDRKQRETSSSTLGSTLVPNFNN